MGNREALIEQAVAFIIQRWPEAEVRRSAPYESEPWGFESSNRFVNVGLEMRFEGTQIDPVALLRALQGIERQVDDAPHRNADGTYRDRPIDIDIIAIDRMAIDTPELQLPHPRAHLRDFVMTPLRELSPEVAEWLSHTRKQMSLTKK